MATPKLNRKRAVMWRTVITVVLVVAAVFVLRAHRSAIQASLGVARHARPAWLVLAIALLVATFCVAAAIYRLLALRSLRYGEILLVQVAAAFTGRLLPAGLGGLGLNGLYLYRRGHTPAEATAVVSVNNLLGITTHLLLLTVVFTLDPGVIHLLFTQHHLSFSWGVAVGLAGVAIAAAMIPAVRHRLARFGRNLLRSLHKELPAQLAGALLLAGLLTALYALLLLSTARSVGVSLGLLQLFVVFSAGMLAGTATPTPGGLVGAEAGLFAGFTAYGVAAPQAGAAVLIFRLVTYWLPLLPGAAALLVAREHRVL